MRQTRSISLPKNSSDISNGPSMKSKRCLAIFAQSNCVESNKATLMVFPAARKILDIEIEIEWSNDHISVATPCQTALGTYELRLGAEDGANKAGIDHLVKTMTYSCGD